MFMLKFFGPFKELFQAISSGMGKYFDLAGKFNKDEIKDIMGTMKEKEMGYFERGKQGTKIKSIEAMRLESKVDKEEVA